LLRLVSGSTVARGPARRCKALTLPHVVALLSRNGPFNHFYSDEERMRIVTQLFRVVTEVFDEVEKAVPFENVKKELDETDARNSLFSAKLHTRKYLVETARRLFPKCKRFPDLAKRQPSAEGVLDTEALKQLRSATSTRFTYQRTRRYNDEELRALLPFTPQTLPTDTKAIATTFWPKKALVFHFDLHPGLPVVTVYMWDRLRDLIKQEEKKLQNDAVRATPSGHTTTTQPNDDDDDDDDDLDLGGLTPGGPIPARKHQPSMARKHQPKMSRKHQPKMASTHQPKMSRKHQPNMAPKLLSLRRAFEEQDTSMADLEDMVYKEAERGNCASPCRQRHAVVCAAADTMEPDDFGFDAESGFWQHAECRGIRLNDRAYAALQILHDDLSQQAALADQIAKEMDEMELTQELRDEIAQHEWTGQCACTLSRVLSAALRAPWQTWRAATTRGATPRPPATSCWEKRTCSPRRRRRASSR